MSHMQGHDDRHAQEQHLRQWRNATQAEYERLDALPLAFLAAEVMVRGFGPGGPGYNDDEITVAHASASAGPTIRDISLRFAPDGNFSLHEPSPEDVRLRQRIEKLVAEGLQQLEHASLVRCQVHHEIGTFDWAATRRGRAALVHGDIPAILSATVPR